MDISIGTYDKATNTVLVRFTHKDVVWERPVNAVLSGKGAYDRIATAERVDVVALGVAVKIEAGIITNASTEATPS